MALLVGLAGLGAAATGYGVATTGREDAEDPVLPPVISVPAASSPAAPSGSPAPSRAAEPSRTTAPAPRPPRSDVVDPPPAVDVVPGQGDGDDSPDDGDDGGDDDD